GLEKPMWSWSRTTAGRERAYMRALPTLVAGLGLLAIGFASDLAIPGDAGRWIQLVAFGVMLFVVIPTSVGTSFCFPSVANAVMSSVPPAEAGVASGTNSALRELGGVLGVAVLASAFAAHGAYGTPEAFVAGFTPAIWIAAALSGLGIVAAVLAEGRSEPKIAPPTVALAAEAK
ncbi:MAG: hypothetical protein M3N47_11575, partial [Chloroflexota bacterium]|nr:hypothetical protein [Chloroflexota bacterium]